MNRLPDAEVGRAPADVAGHRLIDLRVGRLGILLEQRRGAHDLARLAVAALRDVELLPRPLHGMRPIGRQPFYGSNLAAGDGGNGGRAAPGRLAFHVNRAGAAEGLTAAELGPL